MGISLKDKQRERATASMFVKILVYAKKHGDGLVCIIVFLFLRSENISCCI
jgi:hypothetical protein